MEGSLPSYKTERVVLGGRGSVNLSHLFTLHPPKFEKGDGFGVNTIYIRYNNI